MCVCELFYSFCVLSDPELEADEPVVYSPLPLCNSEGHILDYLLNKKNMDVFNMRKELVGKWDDGDGKIVFNEDVKVSFCFSCTQKK